MYFALLLMALLMLWATYTVYKRDFQEIPKILERYEQLHLVDGPDHAAEDQMK